MWESDKLLTAIDKIIRDPDKKYDECMVEQFLKSISDELRKLDDDDWNLQAQAILKKLQSFVDDEAFVMMNQARVYKTYLSVFRSNLICDKSFVILLDHLESFWLSLTSVIINHDLAAITAVLMTLNELLKSEPVYKWIISQKFQPSISVLIRGRKFEIGDVATLAEFYVETSENYHTKNKAESLLKALIKNAIEKNLDENHRHFDRLKQLTSKLMKAKSASILHILISILEDETSPDVDRTLLERFDVPSSLFERFVASSEGSLEALYSICRLLGLIVDQINSESVIGRLEQRGQIEAIIAFLTESPREVHKTLLQSYLLGPLALRCGSEGLHPGADTFVQRLDPIREHVSDKMVTTCLVQLGRTLDSKPSSFAEASVALSTRILLSYIDLFSNTSREFKNVVLCCSNLNKLINHDSKLSEENLTLVMSTVIRTIQSVDFHDESLKPIVLSLIKLLSNTQGKLISISETSNDVSWVNKVVLLADGCTDSDIRDEFDLFLQEFHKDYSPKPDEVVQSMQPEEELPQEDYRADIQSSLNDILDYELFSENILDCY